MVLLRYNSKAEDWDIISQEEKQEGDLYLDGYLKDKLDFAKKQLKRNNDVVGTISGEEGSGKSTMGANIMRYMTNNKFNPQTDMIGAEDDTSVMNKIEATPQRGAIMFDEGNSYFLSTETMKREQRELHKLFSIFRQKNLFVLIVAPSLFRLGSYFAVDRSRFHIRTYLVKGTWGFFKYYGDKKKNKLYREGKKFHDYNIVRANFRGRFTKCYALETEEYKNYKKKTLRDTFESFRKSKEKRPTEFQMRRKFVEEMIKNNPNTSGKQLSEVLNITQQHINRLKKKLIVVTP